MPASKKIAVASGVAFLEPKFAQEHDARASFGHRARVQQPARGRSPVELTAIYMGLRARIIEHFLFGWSGP